MGVGTSDDRGDVEALTLQQQRAQFLLLQQIQEARLMARGGDNANAGPAAAALGSLGFPAVAMPPVDQPALLMSQVLHNPAHLRGKSISLAPGQRGAASTLQFSFDSLAPCVVTVYRSALIVCSTKGGWEVESAAWSSPPVHFPAGVAQTHALEWESLWQSQAMSATFESDGRHCPLLFELRVQAGDKVFQSSVEWTICQLLTTRGSAGKTRVDVVSQQLCLGNSQTLEILDVFGSEPIGDGYTRQDCIVCQSEPRDTTVLPCRHMCLCMRCADYIRTRTQYSSYKCPICREKIGQMMRIDVAGETTELPDSDNAGETARSAEQRYEDAADTTAPAIVAGS